MVNEVMRSCVARADLLACNQSKCRLSLFSELYISACCSLAAFVQSMMHAVTSELHDQNRTESIRSHYFYLLRGARNGERIIRNQIAPCLRSLLNLDTTKGLRI